MKLVNPRTRHGLRAPLVALAVVLTLALQTPVAPSATAHCDPGTDGLILGIMSTCEYNDSAEIVIDGLNAASDDSLVYVLIKDMRFHPEVVDLKSGGTLVMVYADTDAPANHDPKSSGSTGDVAVDVAKPSPDSPGNCFAVSAASDNGAQMSSLGEVYPLTFEFDGEVVRKSRGFQSGQAVGDLTGAQNFRTCPDGTVSYAADGMTAVLPYHCGLHGGESTSEQGMRAAVRLHIA